MSFHPGDYVMCRTQVPAQVSQSGLANVFLSRYQFSEVFRNEILSADKKIYFNVEMILTSESENHFE